MPMPDPTRRDIIAASFALPMASMALAGPSPLTRSTRRIAFADFGGSEANPDNSAAMRAAMAALADGGGIIDIGSGTYRFASSALGQSGLSPAAGTTIRGAGPSRTILQITGNTACNLFFVSDQSQLAFEELAIIGNNVSAPPEAASSYGIGTALRITLTRSASTGISGIRLTRLHLENFRGPWWIEIENQSRAERGLEIRSVMIDDLSFTSRPGNSIAPGDIRFNAAAICLNGHSGMIRDVKIRRLTGNARYLKSGIILYNHIVDARLQDVHIDNAGRDGARDDAGAYAIQVYDGSNRMTSIIIADPVIRSPRSAGIYVAGGKEISIINPTISGQSDEHAGTLPKGAIVFNGTRNWKVVGGTLRTNWRDVSIAMPASGSATQPAIIGGQLVDIRAEGSQSGIAIRAAAGYIGSGIVIQDCRWRTRGRTVMVQNNPGHPHAGPSPVGGYVNDISFERCHFEADTGFRAIDLWVTSGSPASGYAIVDCALIGTNPLYAREHAGSLRISNCDIRDRGTIAGSAAATLIACPQLDLSNLYLRSPGPNGVGINLAGSRGSLRGLSFVDCTRPLPVSDNPPQLGRGRPRFTGVASQIVQNLEPRPGQPAAWISKGTAGWVSSPN